MEEAIEYCRQRIEASSRVVFLSGAGVSAESGVPTFRGEEGLWKNYRVEELATPEAFYGNPEMVWQWYDWRRGLLAACAPNAGHLAVADLEKRNPGVTVITQNVDGLHQAAGSKDVIELHGNIWFLRCTECGLVREERQSPLPALPRCETCQAMERPHVVWFGETLDSVILEKAFEAVTQAEILVVAGTSGLVQPAASLGYLCQRSGGEVFVVNIEETPHGHMTQRFLCGKSGEILPRICGVS